MDNEMIERVSKTAYEKFNESLIPFLEPEWQKLPEDFKFRMKEAIKDGIKAMREPTEKMSNAAMLSYVKENKGLEYSPTVGWKAMIDVIIND